MKKCDLPDRRTLEEIARRYRIDGYELDDLVQEAYLALLEAERDRGEWSFADAERHLNRLRCKEKRSNPRQRQVRTNFLEADERWLCDDNSALRSCSDIEALTLLIAMQSLCRNENELLLLSWLIEGTSYRELCQRWGCNKNAAWKRVSRLRDHLASEVEI